MSCFRSVDLKVVGGKLLRVDFCVESGVLKFVKISGDFFLFPQDSIFEIEKFLVGVRVDQVCACLNDLLDLRKIVIVGFSAKDLQSVFLE